MLNTLLQLTEPEKALITGVRALGIELTEHQLLQFRTYYRELVEWNERVNLTTITQYEDVLTKHFLDSLTVRLAFEEVRENGRGGGASETPGILRLLDVGAGAGFPGLPLRLTSPRLHVTLLDSIGKKTAFLRHLVDALHLEQVTVVTGRAEEVAHQPEHREHYHLVVSRAVDAMATLAEYQLPFLLIGGRMIAMKKGDIALEMNKAERAISLLGGDLLRIIPVRLPQLEDDRCLVVIEKVHPTLSQYPRRAGLPAKRPL